MTYYHVYQDRVTTIVREPDGRGFGETFKQDPDLPDWVRDAEDGLWDENGEAVTGSIDDV